MPKMIRVLSSKGDPCFVNTEKIACVYQPNLQAAATIVFCDGHEISTREKANDLVKEIEKQAS